MLTFVVILAALSVSTKLYADFGIDGLNKQIQDSMAKMQEGFRGLNSAPHEDLSNCSVKDLALSAASFTVSMKANCDGTDRSLVFMPADKEIAKLIYSEAMAAFLSNSKLNFQQVVKFEAGFFSAQSIVLTR